jgi:hypothetical protein
MPSADSGQSAALASSQFEKAVGFGGGGGLGEGAARGSGHQKPDERAAARCGKSHDFQWRSPNLSGAGAATGAWLHKNDIKPIAEMEINFVSPQIF